MANFVFEIGNEVIVDELQTYRREYNPYTDVVGTVRFRNIFGQGPESHAKGRWFKGLAPGTPWYVIELPHGQFEDVPETHLSPAEQPPIMEIML